MAHDLGDTVGLATTLRDSAGDPANAVAAVLTITKPDGTTEAPSVTNPPAVTGQYAEDYVPAVPGRYVARWVFTTPDAAYVDTFDVREADPGYVVSLADAKLHLNITATNTTHDEELRGFIETATHVCEFFAGPIVVRTYVERYDSCSWLLLNHTPVVSITSVVPWRTTGTTYDADDLRVDPETGRVERKDGGILTGGPFEITYKAGRAVMPANLTKAAVEIVKHGWKTQRGTDNRPRMGGEDTSVVPGLGYAVPNRALQYLQPHKRAPMVG